MKKGRSGFRVEITVAPAEADQVTEALFRHSTTAGIRRYSAERVTLARREVEVTTADGVGRARQGAGRARRASGQAGIRGCGGAGPPNWQASARGGKGLAIQGSPIW